MDVDAQGAWTTWEQSTRSWSWWQRSGHSHALTALHTRAHAQALGGSPGGAIHVAIHVAPKPTCPTCCAIEHEFPLQVWLHTQGWTAAGGAYAAFVVCRRYPALSLPKCERRSVA